jgi:DNA end-binding protein Ku
MARAVWTGSLSFGLVNVPVSLYSATEDKTVHFHEFAEGTSDRIRNKRVNEHSGREVDYDDIVKGYELDSGKYVMLTREELEEVEPGRSRTIEISDFVEAAQIDPIFYKKTYYLGPREDGDRAYALLRDAMDRAGRIAIATLVMRAKQHLAAVRPAGKALVLETMFFADEVRKPEKVLSSLPSKVRGGQRDMDTAIALIESMTTEWKPENYKDTYRNRVMSLIKAKGKGREVVPREEAEPSAEVVDLLDALRKSVEASKSRKGGSRKPPPLRTRAAEADKKPARKKATPAKKTTSRKKAS